MSQNLMEQAYEALACAMSEAHANKPKLHYNNITILFGELEVALTICIVF